MKTKEILFDAEMRNKVLAGAKKIYDAVRITMGSKGRNVIYEQDDPNADPMILNDGVRIARQVRLKDKWERLGANLLRQASEKTNYNAGDGTTLTIVLAYAILYEGLKAIEQGANPIFLKNDLQRDSKLLIDEIKKNSRKLKTTEEIEHIASISSQSKEIGKIIAEITEEVGRDMPLTVEEGKEVGISKKIVEGIQFDKGYITPYFATNPEKMTYDIKDCHIILIDERVCTSKDMISILNPFLEGCTKTDKPKNLLIIADDIEMEALSVALENHIKGGFRICCVQPPHVSTERTEFMRDVAVSTGATYIGRDDVLNLKKMEYQHFGFAKRVLVDAFSTTIVDGEGEVPAIQDRIKSIEALIKQAEDEFIKNKLEVRVATLKGKVGILQARAKTDNEQYDQLLRIEDAVLAAKCAIKDGIVVGGGKALYNSISIFNGLNGYAIDILKNASSYPISQIVTNAGDNPDYILSKIQDESINDIGYNSTTNKIEEDMFKAGIIDPLKVITEALENAVSIAGMLLTTDCGMVIAETKQENDKS